MLSAMPELDGEIYHSDHDILIALSVKLTRLLADVKEIKQTVTENQESRLRALENFRWWVLGVSATVSFLGGMVSKFIFPGAKP